MMLIIALILISITVLVIASLTYSGINNPVSYYTIPWLLATVLACTGLYGIYQPDDSTIFLIIVSICFFSVGCFATKALYTSKRANTNKVRYKSKNDTESTRRYGVISVYVVSTKARRLLLLLCIISIAIEAYLAVRTIPLLMNGASFEYIKFQYSNSVGATLFTTRELLVFQWVSLPILYVSMITFACKLINQMIDWPLLIISVAGCVLYIFVSGGRMILFIFLSFIIIAMLISPQRKGFINSIASLPLLIKGLLALAIVGIVLITSVRSLGNNTSILENLFFYFAGPITYFDQILQNPYGFGLMNGQLLFGKATFGFITNPLEVIVSILFNTEYIGSDTVITSACAVYLPFNDNLNGNALCTCLYPFMRDFGALGVALGPVFFGFIIGCVWEITFPNHTINWKWFPICIFLIYCVVFSEWRYTLLFPFSSMTIALIFILNNH